MTQTTSAYQVGAFTVPVNGTTNDANDVLTNDNSLRSNFNNHDADSGVHLQSSVVASRPAAGAAGRKWLATDSGALYLYFDTGSTWSPLSYLTLGGGTLSGLLTASAGAVISAPAAPPPFDVLTVRNAGTGGLLKLGSTGVGKTNIYFDGAGSIDADPSAGIYLTALTPFIIRSAAGNDRMTFPTADASEIIVFGPVKVLTGNLLLGTSDAGNGVGVFAVGNATGLPGTPAGGGVIYCQAGALKYRGSSGTTTTLAVA